MWLYLTIWAHTEELVENEFWIIPQLCGCVQGLMECDKENVVFANYYNRDCLITTRKNLNRLNLL